MTNLPVCRICSSFVADPVEHFQWHQQNNTVGALEGCPLCGSGESESTNEDQIWFNCGHVFSTEEAK